MVKASSSKLSQAPPDASVAELGDELFAFLYKPHTITAMVVGGVILVYFAFTRDETIATASNVKRYMW